jgi:IS5 family transposase
LKQAALKLNLNVKKTRKQVFLEQMEQVLPWDALVELLAPSYPEGKTGRPRFLCKPRFAFTSCNNGSLCPIQTWNRPFFHTPLYREFAQLEEFGRLPDESTILHFRHRLEKHKLAEQIQSLNPTQAPHPTPR